MSSDLQRARSTRIRIGSVLVALVIGVFALDWWLDVRVFVSAVIALLGLAGWVEFAGMAGLTRAPDGSRVTSLAAVGTLATGWFLALPWWRGASTLPEAEAIVGGVVATVLLGAATLMVRRDFAARVPALAGAIVGVLLFGVLFSYVLRIYRTGDRDAAVLRGVVFFLGVKGTDIVAYLVGSAIGRVKFLPVSPGKSLEGFCAAFAFGGLWFAGAGALWPDVFFGWWPGVVFGILLAFTSALGDLTESLLKRHYGVKDSGSLLPEFGGVLDLIDSFLFSAFVFWCLV